MSYLGRTENKSSDIRRFDVTSSTSATHTLTWTPPNELSLIVTINGVKQHEDAYSVSGTTLTLTSALVAEDKLEVIGINDLGTTITPAQNSVTNDHITNSAAIATSKVSGALTSVASHGLATSATTDTTNADNIGSGTLATARLGSTIDLSGATVTLPAASVTAHVTAFDDSAVRNDIATLALHSAIADNKAAYNLSNAFIDQFEDDTGIDVETASDRDAGAEYMGSITRSVGTAVWVTGDRTGTVTITNPDIDWLYSTVNLIDGSTAANSSDSTYPDTSSQAATDKVILHFDMGAAFTSVIRNLRLTSTNSNAGATCAAKYQGSVDNSSWSDLSGVISSWGVQDQSPATVEFGDSTFTANEDTYRYFRVLGTSGTMTNSGWWHEIELKESPVTGTVNAAGNYTSTTQTSTASVSSMGIVVLYKNNEGTATLNTDLVAEVSANGGTNYSSATLVAGGTFSSGINIAAVSGVSVTAGTTPKYKISFANQAQGSKETQVHGVALLY